MTDYYFSEDKDVLSRCLGFIGDLPTHKKWHIKIVEDKKNLTYKQRNYWHRLIDIISADQGDTPADLKMRLKYSVLPLKEVIVRREVHLYPPSSEDIDREAYGDLITATIQLAGILGIALPMHEEYGI